jgi:CheY-like chemotaxis protein
MVRRTLKLMLERAGHEVEEAEDGDQGLAKFCARRPDLVLIDIIMPNREGVETIAELRRVDPQTPIVAMSGGGQVDGGLFLDLATKLGATRTLKKPIRSAQLLAVLEECVAFTRTPGELCSPSQIQVEGLEPKRMVERGGALVHRLS